MKSGLISVLIIGSTSTVARAIGQALGKSPSSNYTISYAGRTKADFFLDLQSADFAFPDHLTFDVVIHAAADFGGNSAADMLRAEMVNAIGTLNVCRLASQVQAQQLIVISTVSATYQPQDAYFGIYSLSKRHADELAQLYAAQFHLPLCILRPTQLYDAESKCQSHQGLFYSIIDKAQRGEDITFYGKNDALRNLLFLDDFSAIIAKVIELKILGTFNCPCPVSMRLSAMAQTAYNVFNQSGSIFFLQDKPDIADVTDIPSREFYQEIGYTPETSLLQGITKIKQMRQAN